MGKLQVLELILAGNQEVFKPGDVVQGVARIVVSEDKGGIRGIQIKCVGKAYTYWTKSEGSGNTSSSVSYTSDYEYFKQEITLQGAGKDNGSTHRIKLTAGEHRFPFQFQIPNMSLPPPFEASYGHVRYYVKVTIDRPWKFDHHTQRIFSICTVKDLNNEFNVLVPTSYQVEKTVSCLCCTSRPIVLKGMIDKRGYVPGEYIFVSLDLQNNSSRRITYVTAKLQQSAHFTAKRYGTGETDHRQSVKTVAELKLAGCEAMESVNYDRLKMLIPPIPHCAYENCPNIQVEYYVEIKGDVSGTRKGALVNLPVVIGTIPAFQHTLNDPSQNPYVVQPIPCQPGAPPGGQPGFPTGGQPGYPPKGQRGYTPSGQNGAPLPGQEYHQPGAPQPGQSGEPPSGQGYPPPCQPRAPSQRRQRYSPPGHPGLPPSGAGPSRYPPPREVSVEEDACLPPRLTCRAAVGGPQEVTCEKGTFGKIFYAPQYPYYDPDTPYASVGIPLGATTSSADGGQPPPIVVQPMSIQQLPRPPDPITQSAFRDHPTRPNDTNQLSYKSFLENGQIVTVL